MILSYWLFLLLLAITMWVSVKKHKLTPAGAIMGGLVGAGIFLGAGFTGIAMLGLFFISGTMATSWKLSAKIKWGVAEDRGGQRTAGQVFANGGVAAIAGMIAWLFPSHAAVFQLMIAAAIASAMADTLSSELGTVYGQRFINLLSLKPGQRGENGVVSMEGTLLGIAGSAMIAAIYAIGFGWDRGFFWIILAGTLGNLADSALGASFERKQLLNNDAVNFINTLVAALACRALAGFLA